jgi:predicted ATPase
VAAGVPARFPNGLMFVELAPIVDPVSVGHAVSAAVGVREEAGSTLDDTLVDALRGSECLLVVDSCQHVVDEAARLVGRLLTSCPA